MTMNFDLIVFDWDGTLMDSTTAIAHAIIAAAKDLELTPPSWEKANHVIGLGLAQALQMATPGLKPDQIPLMISRYRHHYLKAETELSLFAPVSALLSTLRAKNKLLAVATGKSRVGLDRIMAHTQLTSLFHATRCADESRPKPSPDMLLELLALLKVLPSKTLMVGDTVHDVEMAHQAGVASLAVGYGAHPPQALKEAGPWAYVDTPAEMATYLCAV